MERVGLGCVGFFDCFWGGLVIDWEVCVEIGDLGGDFGFYVGIVEVVEDVVDLVS